MDPIYEAYKVSLNEAINIKTINTLDKFQDAMKKVDMKLIDAIMHGPGGMIKGDGSTGGNRFEDEVKQPKFVSIDVEDDGTAQAMISLKILDYDDRWQKSTYYVHFDGKKIDSADF